MSVFVPSFLTVAEGAHRQKVNALITWIKAAGTAPPPLPHPPPPLFFFNLVQEKSKRGFFFFTAPLRREQFDAAYKNHYSPRGGRDCEMI